MNAASTDLTRHMKVLHEKLSHPTDYELAFPYFLHEFSNDTGFLAQGTPIGAEHMRIVLDSVLHHATGQRMHEEQFTCFYVQGHGFFHGHVTGASRAAIFFYFEKSNLGLAAILSPPTTLHQVARFQLPETIARNPGHN